MNAPLRPAPVAGPFDQPMWAGFQQGEFRLQRCKACGLWWFPPGPACPACLSDSWSFEAISGKGRIVAWTRFHKQYFDAMPPPYMVVSVQLAEGPLVIGNLLEMEGRTPSTDMPVQLRFESVDLKGTPSLLPQWAPA